MVLMITTAIIGIIAISRLLVLRQRDWQAAKELADERRRAIRWSPYLIAQITADRRREGLQPGTTQFQ